MSNPLYKQALAVVQEHNLAVIACGEDKAPIHQGWRNNATTDPDKIKEIFSDPRAALIGVPCGSVNDLIVFDLDYREGNTEERNAKLAAFEKELRVEYRDSEIRVHRTRNGGKHIIMLNPEQKKLPRNIMPKLELVYEGFQFIWPTEGSGYTIEIDTPLDELEEPHTRFLKVREKMEGISKSGGLMTAEMADQVMRSDGEVGTRHEAMLRLTQDFVQAVPKDKLKDPAWIATQFETGFREIYGDAIEPTRLEELLNWRVEGGELYGSDLGNALKKPLEARVRQEFSSDRLREQMMKVAEVKEEVPLVDVSSEDTTVNPEKIEGQLFSTYQQGGDREPPAPWLIPNFLRERGSAGFVGASGVGKTTISAAWVAGMLAGNTAAVGLPQISRPLNVAWINGEEEASDLMEHVDAALAEFGLTPNASLICMGEEAIEATPHGLSLVVKKLNPALKIVELGVNKGLIDHIVEAMDDNRIDVVIFDPITEFNDGNENDRGDAKKLANAFKQIAQRTGAATVYWAHTGKMPEGKRPDWYKNDKESQRGSSQNIGALKTMGTVAPVIPTGLEAAEALQYVTQAKDSAFPDVKNLVMMKVLKIKKCSTMISCAYSIQPSQHDPDVPVACWMDSKGAEFEAQGSISGNKELVTMMLTEHMVKRLGEGTHNRSETNKALADVEGWSATMRADRKENAALLKRWEQGVEIMSEGVGYIVRISVPDTEKAAFTVTVKAR